MHIEKGTHVVFLTAGGGGAGDPFERPPVDVARDVELGYVSAQRAIDDYGVAFFPNGEVDHIETQKLRAVREAV